MSCMKDPENENLSNRRAELDAALAKKKSKKIEEVERSSKSNGAWGMAVKISSEFIAGIVAGAGLGYLLDSFAGTAPWGMIVLLMLGFAAGILNVLRSTGKVAQPDNPVSKSTSIENNIDADNGDTEGRR